MFFPAHTFANAQKMRELQFQQRLFRLLRIPELLGIWREPDA
jgi:hypothetical protein